MNTAQYIHRMREYKELCRLAESTRGELREGHLAVSEVLREESERIRRAGHQGILSKPNEAGAAGKHIQCAPGGDEVFLCRYA